MITITMQAVFVYPALVTRERLDMMQINAREHFCTLKLVKHIVINASKGRTCVKDCLHYTFDLFAFAVLFLGPTNAGATTQSVLGVTVMLGKFVLVPFDSHRCFLPVLNSFQLQKDSTCLKAVQHGAGRCTA